MYSPSHGFLSFYLLPKLDKYIYHRCIQLLMQFAIRYALVYSTFNSIMIYVRSSSNINTRKKIILVSFGLTSITHIMSSSSIFAIAIQIPILILIILAYCMLVITHDSSIALVPQLYRISKIKLKLAFLLCMWLKWG